MRNEGKYMKKGETPYSFVYPSAFLRSGKKETAVLSGCDIIYEYYTYGFLFVPELHKGDKFTITRETG